MPKAPEAFPPLLPVIPEYKPWLDRVIKETAADAKMADAAFAAHHGPLSGPTSVPETSRGTIADETT